jgi:hypothetical protein
LERFLRTLFGPSKLAVVGSNPIARSYNARK